LDFECVNLIWFNIVKSKRSGTVLYLFFSAPMCIAEIIKVPTSIDAGEFEENLIADLTGFIETRSVSGARISVVTEAGRQYTLAKRQT
jgi:hypothetical protein